jgi:hypothetical protein
MWKFCDKEFGTHIFLEATIVGKSVGLHNLNCSCIPIENIITKICETAFIGSILNAFSNLQGNGGVNRQEDCRWILLASADEHDTTLEGTNDNVQVGICCHS